MLEQRPPRYAGTGRVWSIAEAISWERPEEDKVERRKEERAQEQENHVDPQPRPLRVCPVYPTSDGILGFLAEHLHQTQL